MKQKDIDLIHEIRMCIVQIGIPCGVAAIWAYDRGIFDKIKERRKEREFAKKFKKD